MARPKKEGLDYFPVDVDFDEKVSAIIMLHENDGLAWVVAFWQKAYKTMSGVVDFRGLFAELFAKNVRITPEKHREILETAVCVGFCYETEKDQYTSNGIQKRISLVSKERNCAISRQKEKERNKENINKNINKNKVKDCPDYSANNTRTTSEESNPVDGVKQKENSFQAFWLVYPRKEELETARQKYFQILDSRLATEFQLIDSAMRYNAYCIVLYDDYPHGRYIKKAKNWLADSGWKEDWAMLAKKANAGSRSCRDEIKQTITDIPMMEL